MAASLGVRGDGKFAAAVSLIELNFAAYGRWLRFRRSRTGGAGVNREEGTVKTPYGNDETEAVVPAEPGTPLFLEKTSSFFGLERGSFSRRREEWGGGREEVWLGRDKWRCGRAFSFLFEDVRGTFQFQDRTRGRGTDGSRR